MCKCTKMFGIVLLAVIGAIFIAILFLFGSTMSDGSREQDPGAVVESGSASAADIQRLRFSQSDERQRYGPSTTRQVDSNQNHATDRFQRPTTPSHSNHYRPATPSNQRPVTPVVQMYNAPEEEKQFRRYNELSAAEKDGIVDLNQCTVYIGTAVLDKLIESIRKAGNGTGVEYVIAYFNKKNDKQLTPAERFVRKSFKIKNKSTDMCRFARFKIVHADPGFYKMVFQDYTPYVEEHAPRFDVVRQEVSKDRSQWVEVEDAGLHHNTKEINTISISILVPKRGD